jgi:hypothetical protein
VIQVTQLSIGEPLSGDLQIVDNGRLIVGDDPDTGQRVLVTKNGLFNHDRDGVLTFAAVTRDAAPWEAGDVFAGYQAGNFLLFDQSAGTLGLYSPAGAGFIAAADGSLYAGDTDGAHMRWNTASRAIEVRNGEDVKISLDANGDAMFDGTVYASAGRIYGAMQVDGLLRAGDVDGPSVSMGRFSRVDGGGDLVESGEIIVTDASNMPWFHVTAGGSTANGGWFHLGGTGDYPQRLTYDGADLVFDGTLYARGGEFTGDVAVTTGAIVFGGGRGLLNADGITLQSSQSGDEAYNTIKWRSDIADASSGHFSIYATEELSQNQVYIRQEATENVGSIYVQARGTASALIRLEAFDTGTPQSASLTVYAVGGTKIDSPATYIGDGGTTNYSQFDATGHLTFAGTAKPWNDMLIEPVARTTGTNAPTFEKWYDDAAGTSRGVYLYSFDDAAAGSEKEVFFNMQMSHAWDGGNVQFHVHWIGAVDDTTATPRWGLEYVWREPGGTYSDTTIVYATGNHLSEADITANKHYITAFAALSPGSTADDLSSVLIGRLFRNSSNAADTYNATGAKCGLLYIDAHYQLARIGSNDEYST